MNFGFIGDGAQFLTQSRANTQLKTQLNTLAAQLSSGEIKDKTQALGGDTTRLSAMDYSLQTLSAKISRNTETAQALTTMQRALDSINNQSIAMSENLTKITRDSPQVQIDYASRIAGGQFVSIVNVLNTEVAGRRLFAGTAVDQPALAPAADMLADLVTAIGGATDEATITAAVDFWFDDPAGGFATMGYLGDTGPQAARRLDDATTISLDARADDPAIVETLKGAAIAALADQLTGLSKATKANMLFDGGVRLQSSVADLVDVQARLGYAESEVARATTTATSEQAALTLIRNDLVNDDPFETASALQAVQLQLETHYQMTARLSRLSLAEYLR